MPNTFVEAWGHGVPVLTLSFDPDGVVDAYGLGIAARGSWERFVAGAPDSGPVASSAARSPPERTTTSCRRTRSTLVGAQWQALFEALGVVPSNGT
jgi:hypothetical protein